MGSKASGYGRKMVNQVAAGARSERARQLVTCHDLLRLRREWDRFVTNLASPEEN